MTIAMGFYLSILIISIILAIAAIVPIVVCKIKTKHIIGGKS